MPRPHTEFIQHQALDWKPLASDYLRPAMAKTLSRDPASGAMTNLLHYEPGLDQEISFFQSADEEFFILDGDLSINGVRYGPGDYGYLPKGFLFNRFKSDAGATVITCWEGTVEARAGDSPGAGYRIDQLIGQMKTEDMAWEDANDPTIAGANVGIKVLRLDPQTHERTWLLRIVIEDGQPFEINGVEQHPCVEECFLIEGDMAMTQGNMRDGAYFWRPPMIPHGPMGTRRGFFGFFRSKEGEAFATQWSEAKTPIDWDAAYRPILPAS